MAVFTAKTSGNWSSSGQTTWNEVGVPGNGDTVTIGAFTVTVDVNTTVGTSPNDATTKVVDKTSATGALVIGSGVTFTVKGNIGSVNGGTLTMQAGSTLTFDNSGSGGSPVYTFVNGGFQKFNFNGSSGSPCVVQAISGQTWKMHGNPDTPTTATYTTFRRSANQTLTCSTNASVSFTNCTWDTGGRWDFSTSQAGVTLIINDCTFTNSTHASDSVAVLYQTTPTSGTRQFMRNVLDKGITWNSKGFLFEYNYIGGVWSAVAGSSGNTIRRNFFYSDGTGNNGNGQLFDQSISRNYFVVAKDGTGNPHFVNLTAKAGTDTTASQNIFEGQTPDLTDFGDSIIIQSTACSGGNKIVGKNNLALPANYSGATSGSGTVATLYSADANVLTEFYRNTANVNINTGGPTQKRGMFAVAEAGTGTAGQVAALKSNLAWGSSSSQGYLAERISGNVKDVITAANADYNWVYNTSAGDNLRGYEDFVASNTMWTAGNTVAAGVDAHQGSGDPSFVDSSRNMATWCAARGYGAATAAAALTALRADVTRIPDLIDYVFEGFKVQNSNMRTAAHDGGVVGAANYHKSTRSLSAVTTFRTYVNSQYGLNI
jgi:hypothetical protein